MFGDSRIIPNKPVVESDKVEEQEEETLTRVSDRIGRGFNTLSWLGDGRFGNAPILVPLIPGYTDRDMHHNESELNSGVVSEVAPQVVVMISDARSRAALRSKNFSQR